MIRLIVRKLAFMVIILALLNYVAFHYALLHPRLSASFYISAPAEEEQSSGSRYSLYLQNLIRGDFGDVANTKVIEVVRDPIKHSLILVGFALAATIGFGFLFGFLSISSRTRRIRPLALIFLAAGSSLPGFVFGAILLSLLVYQLLYTASKTSLLPLSGYGFDRHLLLPVLVLAIQPTFYLAKVTAGLLENELHQDYILVAQSKGLTWSGLMGRHAWANMRSPVLITIGNALRLMIGGLVIVEAIFLWPGIGRIFLFSLGLRLDARPPGPFFGDPELIAMLAVIMGGFLLITDLLVSVLAYQLDPRLSHATDSVAGEPVKG